MVKLSLSPEEKQVKQDVLHGGLADGILASSSRFMTENVIKSIILHIKLRKKVNNLRTLGDLRLAPLVKCRAMTPKLLFQLLQVCPSTVCLTSPYVTTTMLDAIFNLNLTPKLKIGALQHPLCANEWLTHYLTEPNFAHAVLANPKVPSAYLNNAWHAQQLLSVVLANPSLPAAIWQQEIANKQRYPLLIHNANCPVWLLQSVLENFPTESQLQVILKHPNCPQDILTQCFAPNGSYVNNQRSALANPNCPQVKLLESLLTFNNNATFTRIIATNPNASIKTLILAAHCQDKITRAYALLNPKLSQIYP